MSILSEQKQFHFSPFFHSLLQNQLQPLTVTVLRKGFGLVAREWLLYSLCCCCFLRHGHSDITHRTHSVEVCGGDIEDIEACQTGMYVHSPGKVVCFLSNWYIRSPAIPSDTHIVCYTGIMSCQTGTKPVKLVCVQPFFLGCYFFCK